jgi:hypothetical protein
VRSVTTKSFHAIVVQVRHGRGGLLVTFVGQGEITRGRRQVPQ